MPKNPGLDVFPKANLGINERFHLGNLHLMKDWDYTRACEIQTGYEIQQGHKKIETVSHNTDMTAKKKKYYESVWEKQFQALISAEKCMILSKDPHRF